jgi:NADPH2:quinone reductase
VGLGSPRALVMRAVVCRSFENPAATRIEEMPSPTPGPGEVHIRVHAAGVSFANLLALQGRHQNRAEPPFTPGTEIAGTVIATGAGATRFRPGDRVLAGLRNGGFAEQARVPERTVYPLPESVSFVQAVHFPTIYATAYAGLKWRARIAPGETLLVHGAGGGSGLAAIGVGRMLGARVIAVAGSEAKLDAARRQGGQVLLDHREGLLVERVLAATQGRGADVVFDPVGGDAFAQSMKCVAPDGRLIPMGFASGAIPTIPANIALVKNITVIGLYWGHYVGWGRVPPPEGMEAQVRTAFDEMLAWCAQGAIAPETWRTYPLEEFREALQAIAGREVIGRVALVMQ